MAAESQDKHYNGQLARFDAFVQKFDFHGLEWTKLERKGVPHAEILTMVAEAKPDLLVMGTVGRTGPAQVFVGSVTKKVTWEMPCSILTMKIEHVIGSPALPPIMDSQTRLLAGWELLEKGFANEALDQFKHCLAEYYDVPALKGMAAAQERLGQEQEAKESRKIIEEISRDLEKKKIEADARDHLTRRMGNS